MAWDVAGVSFNGLRVPGTQTGWPRAAAPPHAAHTEKKPDPETQRAIRDIDQFRNFLNRRLKYAFDRESNQVIVKVIDGDTDRVVKVLPPEELRRIHNRMRETIGLLFDHTI